MELYSMGPSVLGCLDPLVLTHEGASLTLERRVQSQHRRWMRPAAPMNMGKHREPFTFTWGPLISHQTL